MSGYNRWRQVYIDFIEADAGSLVSIPWDQISTPDLLQLAEALGYVKTPAQDGTVMVTFKFEYTNENPEGDFEGAMCFAQRTVEGLPRGYDEQDFLHYELRKNDEAFDRVAQVKTEEELHEG